MSEALSLSMEQKMPQVLHRQSMNKSGEPGLIKKGIGKGMDIAAGVSKFTIWGFAATWGVAHFAPGAVAAAGVNPATAETIGKWGTITDAATLVFDKFRHKDKGESLPKSGNIFTSSIKSVGGEIVAWPKAAGSQLLGKQAA